MHTVWITFFSTRTIDHQSTPKTGIVLNYKHLVGQKSLSIEAIMPSVTAAGFLILLCVHCDTNFNPDAGPSFSDLHRVQGVQEW